jgi:RNA polymerase sporulation-specific sigma factor
MIDSISLRQLISSLDPKEQQIIILRYFDDKTQSEVAREMGVSQVQVSRIEKKVLLSMRSSLKSTIT